MGKNLRAIAQAALALMLAKEEQQSAVNQKMPRLPTNQVWL